MKWLERFTDLIGEIDQQRTEEAAAVRAHSLSTGRRALNARFQAEAARAVANHADASGDRAGARAANRLAESKTERAETWDARKEHAKW